MRAISTGFLAIALLLLGHPTPAQAQSITITDIVDACEFCGKLSGPLNLIGPAFWIADVTGLHPNPERVFREKMLAQNEKILSEVGLIRTGLDRVHGKLDDIERAIGRVPAQIAARELLLDVRIIHSDLYALEAKDTAGREALKSQLKAWFKRAKHNDDPAQLHFAAATQLAVLSVFKLYELEGGSESLRDKSKREAYVAFSKDLDALVTHCNETAVFLTQHQKNERQYAEFLTSIEKTIDACGLPPFYNKENRDELTMLVEQKEVKKEPAKGLGAFGIYVVRTEKAKEVTVTRAASRYKLSIANGRFLTNLPTADGVTLRVFKPIMFDHFTTDDSVSTYDTTTVVSVPPGDHLKTSLAKYNELVEKSLPLAYEIVLARGIAKSNAKIMEVAKLLRTDCEKAAR